MAFNNSTSVTFFGDRHNTKQQILGIPCQAAADKPGILLLQDVDDSGNYGDHYMWFDSNGNLRHHTSIPTNQDSDGSAIAGGATAALDNLASVAINTSLISDTDDTDDLGSSSKQWKNLYIDGVAYIDDLRADIAELGDAGQTNYIKVADGGVLTMEGTATVDGVGSGNLLDKSAAETVSGLWSFSDGSGLKTNTISERTAASGVTIDSVLLKDDAVTASAGLNIDADSVNLTIGASGATDSYIQFDGTHLTFYDSTLGTTATLSDMVGGLNPIVTGNFTVSDGKFDWNDSTDEAAGTWTFSNTGAGADIDITSSMTTGEALKITANDATSGSIILLDSDQAGSFTGEYIQCYDGSAQDFAVKLHGEIEIAGNDGSDMLTITKGDVQVDDGKIEVDADSDIGSYFKRNQATATSAILTLENTDTGTSSTGSVLDINQLGTGNAYGVELTHNGDYSALKINASAASDGDAIEIDMSNRLDERALSVSGNITGSGNEGIIHVDVGTGVLASTASALRIEGSGNHASGSHLIDLIYDTGTLGAAAADGFMLSINDSSGAQATSYAMYISSSNNEALHVDAGQCLFDELTTHGGGITIADSQNLTIGAGGELVFANGGTQVDTTIATNAWRVGDGAGTNCTNFAASTGKISFSGTARPTQSIWLPASVFASHTGSPAEALTGDGTDKAHSWALDKASAESVATALFVPLNMDVSADVTAYIYWCANDANTNDVKWDIITDPLAEDEDIDADNEKTDSVTDTEVSANPWDLNVTSGVTIGAASEWADGDFVTVIVQRDGADAGDTVDADANFLGLRIDYTAEQV